MATPNYDSVSPVGSFGGSQMPGSSPVIFFFLFTHSPSCVAAAGAWDSILRYCKHVCISGGKISEVSGDEK